MTKETLTIPQEDALALLQSATNISQARQAKDKGRLIIALDENMQLWTAIQTLISKNGNPLPAETKNNLLKLANFVVAKTIRDGSDASEKILDTLENMNLQIAEGLLEGDLRAA